MNDARELTLKALLKEKIITKAQFEKLNRSLLIIPCKKGNFGKAFAKIFGEPDKEGYLQFKVSKVIDIDNQVSDEEEKVDKSKEEAENRFKDV